MLAELIRILRAPKVNDRQEGTLNLVLVVVIMCPHRVHGIDIDINVRCRISQICQADATPLHVNL